MIGSTIFLVLVAALVTRMVIDVQRAKAKKLNQEELSSDAQPIDNSIKTS